MGRRSINTTKSGKYMNPTDQARKEARKRELKKNKKQRMLVRQAVLKGKDPLQLLTEMEIIDQMEYNTVEAPKLNEKVLKDKRRKLKETFQRVVRLYEKENPDYAKDLKKAENDYEKKRMQLQLYFEQVKTAERVQLDQIPLPDFPQQITIPSMIPLPNEIPLPTQDNLPHGILKKPTGFRDIAPMEVDHDIVRKRKPPGPPPGPPPILSDSEDEEYDPEKGIEENIGTVDIDVAHPHDSPDEDDDEPHVSKSRKIRFIDDDTRDPDEEEKDTRLKYKAPKGVTALQAKMLQMAGQEMPEKKKEAERRKRRDSSESSSDSDSDEEDRRRRRRRREDERERERKKREDEEKRKARDSLPDGPPGEDEKPQQIPPGPPPGAPPGLPQGLPPGPPPGAPPMMFRPMRGPLPRMLPPGPPPGRPSGLPPGPPPGLPPNIRMPPRMPPGPPGVPPPRMLRPPGAPPGVPPPRLVPPGGQTQQNPNVISAQPSIMKPPLKSSEEEKTAIIEAKPQIKNVAGDVTRFTPVALKVKRDPRDAKGRVIKKAKEEEKRMPAVKSAPMVPAAHTKTKDDAYDQFMREMEDLI